VALVLQKYRRKVEENAWVEKEGKAETMESVFYAQVVHRESTSRGGKSGTEPLLQLPDFLLEIIVQIQQVGDFLAGVQHGRVVLASEF